LKLMSLSQPVSPKRLNSPIFYSGYIPIRGTRGKGVMTNVPSKLCRCTCVHRSWDEHTQENLGVHINVPSKNVSCMHIFQTCRSKYRWVPIKCCTQEIFCAHRLQILEGTLMKTTYRNIQNFFYRFQEMAFIDIIWCWFSWTIGCQLSRY